MIWLKRPSSARAPRGWIRHFAWLAALALVVTGCGSEDPVDPESEPTMKPAAVPDGFRLVTASETRIDLAVPEDWVVLSDDAFENSDQVDDLEEAARSMGLTPEQLAEFADEADLIVRKDAEAVTVTPASIGEIPTEQVIRDRLADINTTNVQVKDTNTPLGEGRVASYRLPPASDPIFGSLLVIPVPDSGYAVITVTADRAKRSTLLTDTVIKTLRPAKAE